MGGPVTAITPPGVLFEEVVFNLAAGATRDSAKILDTKDWSGSAQAQFAVARVFGFPFLDALLLAPGNANLILQLATNSTPTVQTPTLTWINFKTIAAPAGVPTPMFERIPARFARLRVVDTSAAANNGIYLVSFVRGA